MPRVGGLAATTPTTQPATALPRWLNSLQFRTVLERVEVRKSRFLPPTRSALSKRLGS